MVKYTGKGGEVVLPDGVSGIGWGAFSGCSALTIITLPDSVTSVGHEAFYGCSELSRVDISSIEAWIKIPFEGLYSNPLASAHNLYLNGLPVTDLVIPDSVTSIGDWAFYGCRALTSITLPDSVTSIGDDAFYNTAYYSDPSNWDNDVLYIGN